MLNIRNISAQYKGMDRMVLNGVSCVMLRGQFTCILGPNGSGKTSLLRCITGLLPLKGGTMDLDGADIRSLSARQLARKMALVPQISAIQYELTVEDVVMMGRNPHIGRLGRSTPEDTRYVREALNWVDMECLSRRSILTLSGGEWQRMIIARALAQQSPLLLMDEPVSGLDIRHQAQILLLSQRLVREKNMCVVCVLHDINAAARFADQALLMDNGRIVDQGGVHQVLTQRHIESVYRCPVSVRLSEEGYPQVQTLYRQDLLENTR